MTKRLALAFLTKDRVELTEQSVAPLLHDDIDLWWIDGSTTERGQKFHVHYNFGNLRANVTGGADRAIVFALTTLLADTDSSYLAIVENDCLAHSDWLGPTLALFERGAAEGLLVGAASPRCYVDRILMQRDGYAVVHNHGTGFIILTRKAARLVLDTYRSHWTTGNVKIFQALSGIDIRRYWAFRGHQHFVTVDWGINAILAAHGLASLALTPSPCEMIGQDPPLAEQGLTLATEPVELLRDDNAFRRFADTTLAIRKGHLCLPDQTFCRLDDGSTLIFSHQLGALKGVVDGPWLQKWSQGFGPFAYVSDFDGHPNGYASNVEVPIVGPCTFFVGGGKTGGKVRLVDTQSGYEIEPDLPPGDNTLQLVVPGSIHHRVIRLTALVPGVTFYGVATSEPQPVDPAWTFGHSVLPKPA